MDQKPDTPPEMLTELRQKLDRYFNQSELQNLCFDLKIDYQGLPGESKTDKARELVAYCERHSRTPELVTTCRKLRPKVEWPDLSEQQGKVERHVKVEEKKYAQKPRSAQTLKEALGHPMWQGIGAIVAILAIGFAIITWGVPALSFHPTPILTITPTSTFTPEPTLTRTPTSAPSSSSSFTPTPSPTLKFTPTPTIVVVDSMDDLAGRTVFTDTDCTVNLSSVQGMVNNAIQISFDLKQGSYVGMSKVLKPGLLAGTQGIRFYYKAAGPSNTLELKLLYAPHNGQGEVFSFAQREILDTGSWQTFEQVYDAFACADTCTTPGQKLDPARVWKMDIAVSHQQGGAPGPGNVTVDQVEAFWSPSACPTQRDYHCLQNGALATVAAGAPDMYCAETVKLPQPTLAYAVYISMTKRTLGDYGYSLYEVEAYGPDAPAKNLLLGRTVSASTWDDGNVPQNVTDGKMLYSRWDSTHCCSTPPCPQDQNGKTQCDIQEGQDPQWLKITLPTPATIDRVVLKWERAYAAEYCVFINP